MLHITTISTKGQVTLPLFVRTRLGIKTGDKAMVSAIDPQKNQVTLEILPPHDELIEELYGSLKTNMPYVPIEEARQKAGEMLGKKYAVKSSKRS